jgi:hypothetical protein
MLDVQPVVAYAVAPSFLFYGVIFVRAFCRVMGEIRRVQVAFVAHGKRKGTHGFPVAVNNVAGQRTVMDVDHFEIPDACFEKTLLVTVQFLVGTLDFEPFLHRQRSVMQLTSVPVTFPVQLDGKRARLCDVAKPLVHIRITVQNKELVHIGVKDPVEVFSEPSVEIVVCIKLHFTPFLGFAYEIFQNGDVPVVPSDNILAPFTVLVVVVVYVDMVETDSEMVVCPLRQIKVLALRYATQGNSHFYLKLSVCRIYKKPRHKQLRRGLEIFQKLYLCCSANVAHQKIFIKTKIKCSKPPFYLRMSLQKICRHTLGYRMRKHYPLQVLRLD